MKVRIFSGIFLIVFSAIFAKLFLEEKEPLTYYLSDRIPTKFTKASEQETIQVIELLNQGNKTVERAVLKINSRISSYEINKVIESDSVITNNNLEKLELVYLKIPPAQKISIIIKSLGNGITYTDLTALHENGIGIKGSDNESEYQWVLWVLIIIYIFLIAMGIRNNEAYSYVDYLFIKPYKNVLLVEKPKLIKDSHWQKMRKKSIELSFINDYSGNISGYEFYKFLDSEKSPFLTPEEWHEITKKAEEKFFEVISQSICKDYTWSAEKYGDLAKPRFCSTNTWDKIVKIVTDLILAKKLIALSSFPRITNVNELISIKPSIIPEKRWNDFKKNIVEFSLHLKRKEEFKDMVSALEALFKYEKIPNYQGEISDEN